MGWMEIPRAVSCLGEPGREESFFQLFLIWVVFSSLPFEFSSSRARSCLCRAETFHVILQKSMAVPPPPKGSWSPQAQSDLTPLEAQL